MQTLEFTRALNLIVEKLKARELIRVWEPLIDTRADGVIAEEVKNRFSTLIFSSNAGYARLLDLAPTRKILEKLNIAQVYEPARLGTIIAAISSSAQLQQIWGNGYSYAAFYSLTEQLWSLVRMELACRSLLEEEKKGKIDPGMGLLELELIEYSDEVGICPKRLEIFVASITELHTDLMLVHGLEGDRLTFKYFDSGSGFLVAIAAAKTIIDSMNALLSQWWDKMRFWRYDTFDKKMEAISKSLTIVETVHEAVVKGLIPAETRENLKLRILREANKLTEI